MKEEEEEAFGGNNREDEGEEMIGMDDFPELKDIDDILKDENFEAEL